MSSGRPDARGRRWLRPSLRRSPDGDEEQSAAAAWREAPLVRHDGLRLALSRREVAAQRTEADLEAEQRVWRPLQPARMARAQRFPPRPCQRRDGVALWLRRAQRHTL